ncbi:hypothetical protein BDF22DRAFT_739916 [Syncephalis plumigaleata]|nr:hypothetical protein BDF22DRAFT_739916 [Syncephalis plumigaleata]
MPLDRINETEQETIVRIVKQITRAGENEPNPQQLKAFKDFCKKSNTHTTAAYEAIFMQLRTKHAQVRLASLQLLVVLYERSQRARSLTHKDLNDWIQLTVGVHNEKLPPPKEYANRVRQLMLNSLRSWHDQRGERHRELRLAYEYLKHDIGVDFGDTRGAAARLTHRNDETAEEKQEKIRRNARLKRYEAIRQTIERGMPLVKENLMDMESCFNILVPNLFEDSMSSPDSHNETQLSSSNSTTTTSLRQTVYEHGLGSSRYSLTINLGDADRAEVAENPENHILFEELRSGRRLLRSHHLPRVSEWLDALGHSESEIPQARDTMLKECIDLKERIELALQKCDELNITDERDEDDEFEEVPVYGNDKESSVKHKDTKATSCTEQSSKSIKSTLRGLFAPMDFPGIEQDPTYAHTSKTSSTLSSVAQGKQPMDMNNKVDEQQQQQLSNTAKDNNNNDNDDGESAAEKLDPERADEKIDDLYFK